MYFLFPNTDYLLKNENSLVYISNKALKGKANFNSDEIFEIINEFTDAVFLNEEIEKFLNCSYPKNISNLKFINFLKEIKPTFCKMLISFDLSCGCESLEYSNADNFDKIKFMFNSSEANCLVIFFNISLDLGNLEYFENCVLNNFNYVMRKIIYFFTAAKFNESLLGIKFNFKIKNEEEVAELNKLSSRSSNFNNINFHNNNNNYAINSHRDIKSAREAKSKRDRDKIFNYFYDSQTKNVFEILTFELTTIINNLIDFPQLDIKSQAAQDDKDDDQEINNIIQSIYEYSSNNNYVIANNNKSNYIDKTNKIERSGKDNKNIITHNDKNRRNSINNNLGQNAHGKNTSISVNHIKKNKKQDKISRKLNIEFNEITPVYKKVQEIVKYSTDPMFEGNKPKMIKLDYNLHSEKLFFYWEKPLEKKENVLKLFKQRNKEYNTLRNIINTNYKYSKLNEWNILLNLQNMFLEDNIRKTYKIEKSNINLHDYLQKIH